MDVPDGHIYGYDANVFLKNIRPKIVTKLKNELGNLKNLKFQLALKVLMVKHIINKQSKGGEKEYSEPVFRHKQEELFNESGIDNAIDKAYEVLNERIEGYMSAGSGWVFN